MKELQPKKPKQAQQPWKETHNHNYMFEIDVKRLQSNTLKNSEIVSNIDRGILTLN